MDDRTRMALGGLLGGLATGMTKAWEQNREALMKSQEFAWKANEGAMERTWKSGESDLTRKAEKENLGTKLASEERQHKEKMGLEQSKLAQEGSYQKAKLAIDQKNHEVAMKRADTEEKRWKAFADAQESRATSAEDRNQIMALRSSLSSLTEEAKALTSKAFLDRGQVAQLTTITKQITAHREALARLGDVGDIAPGLSPATGVAPPTTGGTPPATNTGAGFDPNTILRPFIFKNP